MNNSNKSHQTNTRKQTCTPATTMRDLSILLIALLAYSCVSPLDSPSSFEFPFLRSVTGQGSTFNFSCCFDPSYTNLTGTWNGYSWTPKFVPQPACCCSMTLYTVADDPVAFLANYSSDATAAGGGGQNYTGQPLLPGTLNKCNCSITRFGYQTTPNITYDTSLGMYVFIGQATTQTELLSPMQTKPIGNSLIISVSLWSLSLSLLSFISANVTTLPFTCSNTTWVAPWVPPPINYTYDVLMAQAIVHVNFTNAITGQHYNRVDRSQGGVSLGTSIWGYDENYVGNTPNNQTR